MAVTKVFKSPRKPQQVVQTCNDSTFAVTIQIFETWIVETNNAPPNLLDPIDVIGASDGTNYLPVVNALYNFSGGAIQGFCRRVQPRRTEEVPTVFEVEVEFEVANNPSNQVKLAIAGVPFHQVTWYDKDNKPVRNSAGYAFDPLLTKTYYDMKFGLSWETYTVPPIALIFAALGKVNSDTVTLAAGGWSQAFTERQLKMDDATVDYAFQGTFLNWTVSISMLARSDTWVDKILDQGRYDSGHNPLVDAHGGNTVDQMYLDGGGNQLGSGGAPVFLTFKIETEAPFAGIIATAP